MPYDYFSAYMRIASTPSVVFRNDLQAVINSDFECASDYYVIKSQDRTTELWSDLGVRLTKPYKIELNNSIRDDFYTILFKDCNYVSKLGDMFEFNNYRYMVTDVGRAMSSTSSCFVQRCNVHLKFVSNNNPVIGSTPVYHEIFGVATTSLSMPTENRMVMLSDNEMKVFVPNFEVSRLIKFSNSGTRFLLGNPLKSWSCVAIDDVSYIRRDLDGNDDNGMLVLKLSNKSQNINKSLDNLTLGLAQQTCYGGA